VNLSAPFIHRPVATMLLSLAVVLLGMLAYRLLPVAPLPEMDMPAITVQASLPGASPQVMASSVATPLERAFGQIAGITQMSSRSSQGYTRISLQFETGRDINAAARQVQAAINTAAPMMPSGMRSLPSYRKVNPASAPIMILALTSDTLGKSELYDFASTVLAQSLAQVLGVGEVQVGGSSLPAVRVELEPHLLAQYRISLDDIRRSISATNVRRPLGMIADSERQWQIQANDQLTRAADYQTLIIRQQDGAILRLSDVANVRDDVEDRFNSGFFNEKEAVLLVIKRQSGANIIETIERIKQQLPALQALLPETVRISLAMDRSPIIRATLHEAERTLLIAVALVIGVVFLALGNLRASLVPALAIPVSLIGTFAVIYLLGFSLNVLSLMAMIVAAGLVVDDAIVVLENIVRHIRQGKTPLKAALDGTREVGFTLLSMNLSLVVVFISILFMGGIISSFFKEFAVTLTVAILVSLLVSLTLTPMLCARWLNAEQERPSGKLQRFSNQINAVLIRFYRGTLDVVLRYPAITLVFFLATIAVNIYLYIAVPKTFLPTQDTGQLNGFIRGDDGLSFSAMQPSMEAFRVSINNDPAVENVVGFIFGNNAFMSVRLKPLSERQEPADKVIERLRKNLPKLPGARLFLSADQDLLFGGARIDDSSQYQYLLQSSELSALRQWLPKVASALKALPELTDVSDVGDGALQVTLAVDREQAKRLGIDMATVSAALNNAYSQRQVATIYNALNQYRVVMEVAPQYARDPSSLSRVELIAASGQRVPLSVIARYDYSLEEDRVSHEGQFAAESLSFALAENVPLEQATLAIERAIAAIGLPDEVIGRMSGAADAFKQTQQNQPFMLLASLLVVYLVLGILYESYIHPLTILSTLPSAGVGALLTIIVLGGQFSLISLLGLFLLIGIVKKNAILMIDLALQLEREQGMTPRDSIREACLLRLRPILMTTFAAILGALPLLFASAEGAEMRRPLGIAIIGGLLLSQLLTLYSTPVVYLYLDRARHRFNHWRGRKTDAAFGNPL